MSKDEQKTYVNIRMDPDNLFREEIFTDGKVGAIRRLIPVNPDGTEDRNKRGVLFMGNTQLLSPTGQPVPIQCTIEAKTLEEAVKKFPEAVNLMVERIMAEAHAQQEKQD